MPHFLSIAFIVATFDLEAELCGSDDGHERGGEHDGQGLVGSWATLTFPPKWKEEEEEEEGESKVSSLKDIN